MKKIGISNIDPTYGHYLRRRPGKQRFLRFTNILCFSFSKYIIFDWHIKVEIKNISIGEFTGKFIFRKKKKNKLLFLLLKNYL